jgi:thiol:disulfide interchange protein DsbD
VLKKYLIFYILGFVFCSFLFNYLKTSSQQAEIEQNEISVEKQVEELEQKTDSFFSLENIKKFFLQKETKVLYVLFFAFLAGVLTSFTPCIYPLIPITIGILQSQATPSLWHNFLLAFFYVCGMAFIYACLGYVAATTTIIFGQWLANPWLIAFVILVLIYLAFSMFGFYELKFPAFFTRKRELKVGGSLLYSFLFGMISGTVASPCLTPALVILLGFVAKSASPILGFFTLWFFALGLGMLLLVVGTSSTTITLLPRSGLWMVEIKRFFGFLLLAMCVYFLQPFLRVVTTFRIYAILSGVASVYYFSTYRENKIKIIVGALLAIICLFLLSLGVMKKL